MLQKVNKIQSGNFEIIFIITTINSGTFFTFNISHFLWFFSFGTMQAISPSSMRSCNGATRGSLYPIYFCWFVKQLFLANKKRFVFKIWRFNEKVNRNDHQYQTKQINKRWKHHHSHCFFFFCWMGMYSNVEALRQIGIFGHTMS